METSLLNVHAGKHRIQVLQTWEMPSQTWEIPSHTWDFRSHSNQLGSNHLILPFLFLEVQLFQSSKYAVWPEYFVLLQVKITMNHPTFVFFYLISDSVWQVHAFSHCENVISEQPPINLLDVPLDLDAFRWPVFLRRQSTSFIKTRENPTSHSFPNLLGVRGRCNSQGCCIHFYEGGS